MSEAPEDMEDRTTVFIVDDTLPNIDVLSKILESEGYTIAFAESGEEALEAIPEIHPDLILMDVMMPGIDGFETCKRLKEIEHVKDIPLIFVTAKNDVRDVLQALHVGGVDYITKPVRREEVLARVSTHVQQQRLIKQVAEAEKIANLGSVIAAIAHEINTPIGNGMSAATELQEQTHQVISHLNESKLGKKELKDYLDTAEKATRILCGNLERAGKLVKSFKNVSSKQGGEDLSKFKLKDYVEDVIMTIEPTLKTTKHKLSIEIPEDIELTSYAGALSQVIINLTMNSVTHAYSDPEQAGQLSIQVTDQDDKILITYKDDGDGVPDEHIDKILEPFFTTKRNQGGTGLGLYVVNKTITEMMQGKLKITSKKGEGTTFSLMLPKEVSQDGA